jgi:hypothetical protein
MTQDASFTLANVDKLVRELVMPRRTDLNHFEQCLGLRLRPDQTIGNWSHYVHVPEKSLIQRVALAQTVDSTCTRLTLTFMLADALRRDDALMANYGKPLDVRAAPRVPPEGVLITSYNLDIAQVKFSFSSKTQRLHSVAIEWPC